MNTIKNKTQTGSLHIVLLLFVVIITAIAGTFYVVKSSAVPDYAPKKTKENPHTQNCPGNKIKYGLPKGSTATEKARERVFGSSYPNANVITANFMGKDVLVNEKIANCLKAVEWDLVNKYRTKYTLHTIYGASQVDGNNPKHFFHPYGGAVDINPEQNPFYDRPCSDGCPHDMPRSWVKAFKAHGFYWGGNYKNTKDYMHFEWHGEI